MRQTHGRRPSKKLQLFAEGLRRGKSEYQAAIDAGYSETSAQSPTLLRAALQVHFPRIAEEWEQRYTEQRSTVRTVEDFFRLRGYSRRRR